MSKIPSLLTIQLLITVRAHVDFPQEKTIMDLCEMLLIHNKDLTITLVRA